MLSPGLRGDGIFDHAERLLVLVAPGLDCEPDTHQHPCVPWLAHQATSPAQGSADGLAMPQRERSSSESLSCVPPGLIAARACSASDTAGRHTPGRVIPAGGQSTVGGGCEGVCVLEGRSVLPGDQGRARDL